MANKKSVNLLPEFLRTDKNEKFLSSTLDPLIQTPQIERIDGFIGSKLTPNFDSTRDFYLQSESAARNNYALEPALVLKNSTSEISDIVSYDDLINEIGIQGGSNDNLDRIFRSKYFSFDPPIDWDKIVNFSEYYWLPTGPESVVVYVDNLNVDLDILGKPSYTLPSGHKLTNGLRLKFLDSVIQEKYRGEKSFIVEGVGNSINLIDFDLLEAQELLSSVYEEIFDGDIFDEFPFDGDKKVPINPEYITINRASEDLNAWSRYNRWFHKEVILLSAELNDVNPIFEFSAKAKRPIVEFKPNLQLYNFGRRGIKNIDIIDSSTKDAFSLVDGKLGYYIDGVELQPGYRVVFNVDTDPNVRSKIYEIKLEISTSTQVLPIIRLVETNEIIDNYDSVAVNLGINNGGKSFYFNEETIKWVESQQHTTLNQTPLFDLFDSNGISYTEIADKNNFVGSKIFGYDVGTGVVDPVLKFPLKYQSTAGVGSYLFKNYFMTDIISVTKEGISNNVSTGITYIKSFKDNTLFNVWNKELQEEPIPIVETQITDVATNTFVIKSLDLPLTSEINSVAVFVDNIKKDSILTNTNTIVLSSIIEKNKAVIFKILTEQLPNKNGYYEVPKGLINNPLNGPIGTLTLAELSDHVQSMVGKISNFEGTFPGNNNLRDLNDYAKYGSRLIINSNPIAFSQFFLGKKEHNVVDSTRLAGIQYGTFKMALLKFMLTVNEQLTPAEALDQILLNINKSRSEQSPYFRSDMLGFGSDKLIRTYTITNTNVFEYPISLEFDLTELSFQSVLIYRKGETDSFSEQLLYGKDYTFNKLNNSVIFNINLYSNDLITIVYYPSTKGCYVPPTPTKLGLYPKFYPELIDDATYIRGHDGSFFKTYGDYRDAIVLEFERRIFNNIKVEYNRNIFDIVAHTPGRFRDTGYSVEEFNSILSNDFMSWAGTFNVDYSKNNSFDEIDPFTWNYKNSIILSTSTSTLETVFGTWVGIFKYFYDTEAPNSRPWEMLGFSIEPTWWSTKYGPVTSQNEYIWEDVSQGFIWDGESIDRTEKLQNGYFLSDYARSGLNEKLGFEFINAPVNNIGEIRPPSEFLVEDNSYFDKSSKWFFGDFGPAEIAWRNSSYYPFAANAAMALMYPCDYVSSMYDLSRSNINPVGQRTYFNDDIYLNLKRLIIDGNNDEQIAGFGVFIVERGKQLYPDYINKLKNDLLFFEFNLFHKLGGFTSKEKLQINIDAVDPTSSNPGFVLPNEDYEILLNVSNPIKVVNISGIIIQRNQGKYLVKGYDKNNPYFEILSPIIGISSSVLTVGGVSEQFTDWTDVVRNNNNGLSEIELTTANSVTTRYYQQGQIVRYDNKFYRVKISHTAQSTFDPTLFQLLSTLPIKGGITVQVPSKYEQQSIKIPYGTELNSIQEVYNLILGYGAWLEKQGFIFDEFNVDLGEVIDWKFSGKEFLYWMTQNWADNNLITLSPFADVLKFKSDTAIVDNLRSKDYQYNMLNANGQLFPIDRFSFVRSDGFSTIKTVNTEDGIFFVNLRLIQKEQGIVLNNRTIFNDRIYDIESGYKQARIKLSGFKTKNWNGDFFSPGFIYDNFTIADWAPFKFYLPGEIVRYNSAYYQSTNKITSTNVFEFNKWAKLTEKPISSLIPNLDYKINQFEDFYSLDIDNFDASQQSLAQGLIGYTPRPYLNNLFSNPVSQYKFYQGFIKEKGTKNSLDRLTKATIFNQQGNIEFNEEWLFRLGYYGSYSSYDELEFSLEEGSYLENPSIVKFVDQIPTIKNPLVNYLEITNFLLKPDDYISSSTFLTSVGNFNFNNLELLNAGYARLDDVDSTAFNKNSLFDIANNNQIKDGTTIWLGFLENGDWTVYRYTRQVPKITGVYVKSPGTEITFVTDINHNLNVDDIISVTRFNGQVDSVYLIKDIPTSKQFTVPSTLSTIVDEDLLSSGILFKFQPVRFPSLIELAVSALPFQLKNNDKLWIDKNEESKWVVYQKIDNYETKIYDSVNVVGGQRLGQTIYTAEATSTFLAAAPEKWFPLLSLYGVVTVFNKEDEGLIKRFDYVLENDYCNATNTVTQFGYSLAYDENKKIFFAGAPEASKVKAPLTTGTVILSTSSAAAKSFDSEGLVKISIEISQDLEAAAAVLVSPFAATASTARQARFGHSIYINQSAATTSTILLVGAPGGPEFEGSGAVYAYYVNTTTSTVSVTPHPSGITVVSTSTLSFSAKAKFGTRIVGDRQGNNIAISAPGYLSTISNRVGTVQIFDKNLNWKQTIGSQINTNELFGDDIVISDSGNYLIISSKDQRPTSLNYGRIYIYQLDTLTSRYKLVQYINNPILDDNLKFGYKISISNDEKTLAVSALGTNKSQSIIIDNDNTTFDSNTTNFYNTILDSGSVYVYNKLGNYFVGTTELVDTEILADSKYGSSLIVTNNSIYIGAPSTKNVGIQSIELTQRVEIPTTDEVLVEIESPVDPLGEKPTTLINFVNISTSTKRITGITILNPGIGYKYPPVATLKDDSGIILDILTVTVEPDNSKIYEFKKIDNSINGYKILRYQEDLVDVEKIKKVTLIDTFKEEIIDYLDVIDPIKGKIAGIANQELKYKSPVDPAIYSLGINATVVDLEKNWLDDHVGELWWDLSTAKYLWYEQGDDVYRKNNWGKLFPGATIDVYEWVKSDLLPNEWAAQADTNAGIIKGVSGQPKYPSNNVVSAKQVYNNVTGAFENVYYYWVKNKNLLPNKNNRRLTGFQVASLIADPVANGLKFIEPLSKDSVAFANVQPLLIKDRINANIALDNLNNQNPKHTEWTLLEEGNPKSSIPFILEKKLFDSLLGHDLDSRPVPDPKLSYRNRYGIQIRPRQSLFKNRYEALRNVVEFSNTVLEKNIITGKYSFDTLNKQELIPSEESGEYDFIFENFDELEALITDKFQRAELRCVIDQGKVRNVVVTNQGYGYGSAPEIIFNTPIEGLELRSEIDAEGRVVKVTIVRPGINIVKTPILTVRPHTIIILNDPTVGNKWTKNVYSYENKSWLKIKTQGYNTPLYWNYIDWKKETFDQFKNIKYYINDISQLESISDIEIGDYVKIKNFGDGRYIIVEKIDSSISGDITFSYNIVYSERGTIQINDKLWNANLTRFTYDDLTLDETLYDQIPDLEIYYILKALKDDIFIQELKVNWNLLFFKAVKYALTEQKLLDWAFKTSFINVKNTVGNLTQRPVYKFDNDESFETYINEIKPYHSKIRNFTINYTLFDSFESNIDRVSSSITDFDLPSYFSSLTNSYAIVNLNDPLMDTYPWKWWKDNYTYSIEQIILGDKGIGYTQRPVVTITTASGDTGYGAVADAYIRNSEIYDIILTNPGSDYILNPFVAISQGGITVLSSATASAVLGNNPIRKNKIAIKFDRIGSVSELGNLNVVEIFDCDGNTTNFELSWLAEPNKEFIIPQLDGKKVLNVDYNIDYTVVENNEGYKRTVCTFIFLNYVPGDQSVFKISYRKNQNLYNAADRINNLYHPDNSMSGKENSLLMSGYEYPNTVIQGLPFNYSVLWNPPNNAFESAVWDDVAEYYETAKIVSTVTFGSNIIFLNTTTGIIPGQKLNVLNTSTRKTRTDTYVLSINTNSSITISAPTYQIKSAVSTGTSIGSDIIIRTKTNFYGELNIGDSVIINGIGTEGYNGIFTVNAVDNNNLFRVLSTGTLAATTSSIYSTSTVQIATVIEEIPSDNTLLFYQLTTSTNTGSITISTLASYSDVVRSIIKLNGSEIGTSPSILGFYTLFGVDNRATIFVNLLTPYIVNNIEIYFFTNPKVEFWKYSTLASALDTALEGGSWDTSGAFTGALGLTPEEITSYGERGIIDGETFLSVNNSYGPEEFVPGHVLDSLGINVYTRLNKSNALILAGAFPVVANEVSVGTVSFPPQATAGMMVYFNGVNFVRVGEPAMPTNAGPYYSSAQIPSKGINGMTVLPMLPNVNTFSGPYTLPFNISLWGNFYNTFYIGSNGYITFNNGSAQFTPLVLGTLGYPAIYAMYCDLWHDVSLTGQTLENNGTSGFFISTGTVTTPEISIPFDFVRIRFQGTHFDYRTATTSMPQFSYEITMYSNGDDQYIEIIYDKVWRGAKIGNGDVGFIAGIAITGNVAALPSFNDIEDYSSHLLYSNVTKGGEWTYVGTGCFDLTPSQYVFTGTNQYFVKGSDIYLAPQPVSGRAGYTIVGIGGEDVLDSDIQVVTGATSATVQSLASINDVRKAYVLVDGNPIYEITTTTSYGYILTNVSNINNRACVKIYNLTTATHTLEAWFFETDYDNFNRVNEETFIVAPPSGPTSNFMLSKPPAQYEPVVSSTIVELVEPNDSTRRRLRPPPISYYQVITNNNVFPIDNKRVLPPGYFTLDQIKVYANGGPPLRPGFDYTADLINNNIIINPGLLTHGAGIAIMSLVDYDYVVVNNVLSLATPITNGTLRVVTFTDHDNLLMQTESFTANPINRYVISRPAYNDNYVWVYLNGVPLVHRYDWEILSDYRTIQFNEFVITSSTDVVMVTTLASPTEEDQIVGYRVFKDIFDRCEYKRLTEYHSTFLSKPLYPNDKEIHVQNDDKLITPNPAQNKPGIIIIDAERIEFFEKNGNVLSQLRRSTLGTGPALYSQAGTSVIDQSMQQNVPCVDVTLVQNILTTNTLTYTISISTSTTVGDGITLTSGIDASNQVTIYYGGRMLRKTSLEVHDLSISWDQTNNSLYTLEPEFYINTSTQELTLNIAETIIPGTQITIIQKKGKIWTGTESLLTSEVIQAKFLRKKLAKLPDVYYYGGDPTLLGDDLIALENENNTPLEEY